MSTHPFTACPVCHTPGPTDWTADEPWLCSMACFRAHWHIPQPQPETPSCHDSVTMTCPVCQHTFEATGPHKFGSDAR